MSAYNVISNITATCPRCKSQVVIDVQFKFGATWQYTYRIGDRLRWGRNDIGETGHKRVVVDAISESPCSSCDYSEEWRLYLFIVDDCIAEVAAPNGAYDFTLTNTSYIYIE